MMRFGLLPYVIAGSLALSGIAYIKGRADGWQEHEERQAVANSTLLLAEYEKSLQRSQEWAAEAREAAAQANTLETQNARLRASLAAGVANVEISDPCAQCRFGADAVRVLQSAAAGLVDPPAAAGEAGSKRAPGTLPGDAPDPG